MDLTPVVQLVGAVDHVLYTIMPIVSESTFSVTPPMWWESLLVLQFFGSDSVILFFYLCVEFRIVKAEVNHTSNSN